MLPILDYYASLVLFLSQGSTGTEVTHVHISHCVASHEHRTGKLVLKSRCVESCLSNV
jgi:hypothetical protein